MAIFFGTALQLQITLFSTENYQGLRISSADLLLPLIGLFILFSLFRKKTAWPKWQPQFGYWALILLSVAFAVSMLNGYLITGQLSQWAMVNKGIGWLVLMAYMGAGAWLARNFDYTRLFYYSFSTFFCLVVIQEIIKRFLYAEIEVSFIKELPFYIEGGMYNRNAFAFLWLCTALFISEFSFKKNGHTPLQRFIFIVFWVSLPFCVVMNGSRTLWLTLIPLILFFGFRYKKIFFKTALPLIAIGMILTPIFFHNTTMRLLKSYKYFNTLFSYIEDARSDKDMRFLKKSYDAHRLTVTLDAVELYLEYPLTGAGLGTLLEYQKQKHGEVLSVMDNSLLWILTEMGPPGLFCFVLVYIVMLHTLYKRSRDGPPDHDYQLLLNTAFFMLIGFGFFSLFHEILYSRFLWFTLGMALVIPVQRQSAANP